MRLAPGTRLGPYEVVAPLGAGGMSEVYRAKDTRLGREVAIKVLPEHLTANPEILARFEREARTISSLNHPHICTLYDVGREGDVEYLVMELVEGETLAQRLERGPLPTTEILKLGIQIADALDRAHRAGIVHRDFKPGNVMLTKSGAKLMDFGLARAGVAPGAGGAAGSGSAGVTVAALTQSPTVASPLTAEGTLVGTFLYMAPEQLEGRETDVRSDLWAFGCVLYEMATGRRAFEGKSQASLIGSIMHSEPAPLVTAAPLAPPALDSLIRACLAKDPDERVQTAHDVKLQLTWIASAGSQSGVAAPALPKRAVSREPIAWAVAALAIAAAAFIAWRSGAPPRAAVGLQIRFTMPMPSGVNPQNMPRISPDGRYVAFQAVDSLNRTMIWVRPLNSLAVNPLPGTEGSLTPFWSPDSRYLGFVAGGKLKRIPVGGGPADVICDAPTGSDGSWSKDGVILFDGAGSDPIRRVSAAGGVAAEEMPGDTAHEAGWPAFMPDGKHYFYSLIDKNGVTDAYLGTLGSKKGARLGITGSRVEYSPDGYLLFARDRSLLAQRFDAGSRKLVGDPFPIAEDLPVAGNGLANFSVSGNGILVYRATGSPRSRLVWLDRDGREVQELEGAADYRAPALSPDGNRIAIRRNNGTNLDIWIVDPARGTTTRFTFDPGQDGNPLWSPDGSQIAWSSDRDGIFGFWIKSASGMGADQLVTKVAGDGAATDWSRDGKYVLYQATSPQTGADIYLIPMTGSDHTPKPLLNSPFNEVRARFSPDGRWIAYQSNESGRAEIYAASFTGPAGKWQISTSGGTDPAWSHDSGELFFISSDQHFMEVPIQAGATFTPGTPRMLFRVLPETGVRRNVYDVSPDGKRFLFLLPVGDTNTPMTVAVNWHAGSGSR
jgi:Tol biopolymer transport system component